MDKNDQQKEFRQAGQTLVSSILPKVIILFLSLLAFGGFIGNARLF